jgi:ketosteroid isomerase-like protein
MARMTSRSIEVVEQIFDAFNSEKIERILELTHEYFAVEIPPAVSAEPDVYRGHDGMRRYFESFQDAMEEIRFRAERHWEAGETEVVVAMLITARGRRTAIPVEQRTTAVWTIHEHKAMRVKVFASPNEALAAVGLADKASRERP